MRKEDKSTIIEQIAATVKEYGHFYLVDVTAMNAAATSALRRDCFKSGIKLMVVKNTLLHKALESLEEDFSPLYDSLKGTTAIMFCNTANVPAKLIKDKAKDGIPGLKAAYAEESFYIGADQLEKVLNWSKRIDGTYVDYVTQYIDKCNIELLKTPFEKRKDKLRGIAKRILVKPTGYQTMEADLKYWAKEYKTSIYELEDSGLVYPEEIEW